MWLLKDPIQKIETSTCGPVLFSQKLVFRGQKQQPTFEQKANKPSN